MFATFTLDDGNAVTVNLAAVAYAHVANDDCQLHFIGGKTLTVKAPYEVIAEFMVFGAPGS